MEFLNGLVFLTNFVIVPALAYGAQLAIGALGVTLVYAILRFSNFAHGDTMAFGTAVTIKVTAVLVAMGITLGPLPTALLAMPVGILATGLLVLGTDWLIYKFYRQQKAKPVILVIVSLGVMFVMNGLTRVFIGVRDIQFADGARFLMTVRQFKDWTGLDEGLAIKTTQAITLVTAAITVAALFWFLNKTRTGKSMRAFSDNEDLALLSGIDPDRVVRVTWLIVAALATIAGGFLIAFAEVTVTYPLKKVLTYWLPDGMGPDGLVQLLSGDYKFAVSFMILLIVLLFKPTGLFKGQNI